MSPTPRAWLLLPASIIVASLIISGTIWWSARGFVEAGQAPVVVADESKAAPSSATPPAPPVDSASVNTVDSPILGDPNAPVIMAYWFDYQCPFCRQFEQTAMPGVIENYVNTGKLRVVFKDFAFLGPDSATAGMIARAVWAASPTAFYAWHRAMFQKQDRENGGWGSREDILALTKTIAGVDEAKVEDALNANAKAYQARMESDLQEGSRMGVSGTPTAIIGDQVVPGAAEYQDVADLIDRVLAAKR